MQSMIEVAGLFFSHLGREISRDARKVSTRICLVGRMEPSAVAELAQWENEHWQRAENRTPAGPVNTGLGAYQPLNGLTGYPTADEHTPQIEYLDATAVGSVLVVRFRWPLDEQQRDLLLMVDYRDYPHGVVGSSTWLLEYVSQNLQHDQTWFPRDLLPLSTSTAILRPSRHPTASPYRTDSAGPSHR
jgi:hypothetical protein